MHEGVIANVLQTEIDLLSDEAKISALYDIYCKATDKDNADREVYK